MRNILLGFVLITRFFLLFADPPGPGAGWTLVLEDHFDTFNDKLWTKGWTWYVNGTAQPPTQTKDSETDCYFPPENAYVQNGNLIIVNDRKDTEGGYHYTSGVVNSASYNSSSGFIQTYGYWEARMWVSPGEIEGMCPAFWLPNVGPYEIDIIETPGGKCCGLGATAWFTVHNHTDGREDYGTYNAFPGSYWGDTYHVFGLLWRPDRLCWYTDNVERFCTKSYVPQTAGYAVFCNEIGLGGDAWTGSPDLTPFPQIMQVDWIRVWKEK